MRILAFATEELMVNDVDAIAFVLDTVRMLSTTCRTMRPELFELGAAVL